MENGQTERSGENNLVTTTLSGEILKKPRKRARFSRNQETWGKNRTIDVDIIVA
jgi:7,8-dihydro-6-hydroxymethylpterin-pyrophosphokinase